MLLRRCYTTFTMTSLQPKTQVVTRHNFDALLPNILASIERASFVAIDCEMTGLWRDKALGGSQVDSLDSRWSRVRDSGLHLGLIQYGVATFEWSEKEGAFLARPYSFHLMPRKGPLSSTECGSGEGGEEAIFHTSSSALQFLLDNKFDFQALVANGVSYLSRESEDRLRHVHRLKAMRNAAKFLTPAAGGGEGGGGGEDAEPPPQLKTIVVDVPLPPPAPGGPPNPPPPPPPGPNEVRITHPKDKEWFEGMVASVDAWEKEVEAWVARGGSGSGSGGEGGSLNVESFPSLYLSDTKVGGEAGSGGAAMDTEEGGSSSGSSSSVSFPYLILPPANGFKRLIVRTYLESKWPSISRVAEGESSSTSTSAPPPCPVRVVQRVGDQTPDAFDKVLRVMWVGGGTPGYEAFQKCELRHRVWEVEELLGASLGFRKVIDKITEKGVPVVGHNCWLDFSHTVAKFHGTPSYSLPTWAKQLSRVFPTVYDTKHITAGQVPLDPALSAAFRNNNSLGQAFRVVSSTSQVAVYLPKAPPPAVEGGAAPAAAPAPAVAAAAAAAAAVAPAAAAAAPTPAAPAAAPKPTFNKREKVEMERVDSTINWPELAPIKVASEFQYSQGDDGQFEEVPHDAGFDAFMTGVVFARVAARLASLPPPTTAPPALAAAAAAATTPAPSTTAAVSAFPAPYDPRVPLTPLTLAQLPTMFTSPPPRLASCANTLHVMRAGGGVYSTFVNLDDARKLGEGGGAFDPTTNTLALARKNSYRGNYVHVSGLDASIGDVEVRTALASGIGVDPKRVQFFTRVTDTTAFAAFDLHEHAVSAVEKSVASPEEEDSVKVPSASASSSASSPLAKTFSQGLAWIVSRLVGKKDAGGGSGGGGGGEDDTMAAAPPPSTTTSSSSSSSSSSTAAASSTLSLTATSLSTLSPWEITPSLVATAIRPPRLSDFSVQTYASYLKENKDVFGGECDHEVVPLVHAVGVEWEEGGGEKKKLRTN